MASAHAFLIVDNDEIWCGNAPSAYGD